MLGRLAELIRGMERRGDGYSRALQAARLRASYQRAYFAPALFNLIPVKTDLIRSMAVDSRWRLYYNDAWVAAHSVEENAAVLIHEVSHLLRSPALAHDCGSGAHGERRPWELPDDDGSPGGAPGVDPVKAELVRRDVAQRILDRSGDAGDVPLGWRRWARTVLSPKVDYMATIRHAVRKALRDSTLGRYDRTYRRPHRRQAAYGEFIMSSFYQPRPRPGFLIDTSSSMQDTQLARAVAELGGLTRQLGYSTDVVVACCDTVVHDVRKVFAAARLEMYGGGGTHIGAGLRWFTEQTSAPIDLLVVVSDCHTPWPPEPPRFPVITIRVGDGAPPPGGARGANKVITIEDPSAEAAPVRAGRR